MKLEKVFKGVNCSNRIKGKKVIIFDLDGTLIDSIGIWNEIDKELIKTIGNGRSDNVSKEMKN